MFIGSVTWTKVKGKPNASMLEKRGFGTLCNLPEIGKRMRIEGDYGVTTTEVQSVEYKETLITVTTKNSVYEVKKDD